MTIKIAVKILSIIFLLLFFALKSSSRGDTTIMENNGLTDNEKALAIKYNDISVNIIKIVIFAVLGVSLLGISIVLSFARSLVIVMDSGEKAFYSVIIAVIMCFVVCNFLIVWHNAKIIAMKNSCINAINKKPDSISGNWLDKEEYKDLHLKNNIELVNNYDAEKVWFMYR